MVKNDAILIVIKGVFRKPRARKREMELRAFSNVKVVAPAVEAAIGGRGGYESITR